MAVLERDSVCVCVRERESESERESVCVFKRDRGAIMGSKMNGAVFLFHSHLSFLLLFLLFCLSEKNGGKR